MRILWIVIVFSVFITQNSFASTPKDCFDALFGKLDPLTTQTPVIVTILSSPEDIIQYLRKDKSSSHPPLYSELIEILNDPLIDEIDPKAQLILAQTILEDNTDKIKRVSDLKIYYDIALKKREFSSEETKTIFYDNLSRYLYSLICLEWSIFSISSFSPKIISVLTQIIDDPLISTKDKNHIILLYYYDPSFRFTTLQLTKALTDFLETIQNTPFSIHNYIRGRRLESSIEMLLSLLKKDRIDLSQAPLIMKLISLKKNDPSLTKTQKEELEKIEHKIKIGGHLPVLDYRSPSISSLQKAWLNPKIIFVNENAKSILYPPLKNEGSLTQHSDFLERFFSNPQRIKEMNFDSLTLWHLLEDPRAPYDTMSEAWKENLWNQYRILPDMLNGRSLPDLISSDYKARCNTWLWSNVTIQKSNHHLFFKAPSKKLKQDHGQFLSDFFQEGHTRFEGTDLDYDDLIAILKIDIPGDWKKSVTQLLLPKVIFKNGQIIKKGLHLLISYIRDYPLDQTMISSLITALDAKNLSVKEKYAISEQIIQNPSYLKHCSLYEPFIQHLYGLAEQSTDQDALSIYTHIQKTALNLHQEKYKEPGFSELQERQEYFEILRLNQTIRKIEEKILDSTI